MHESGSEIIFQTKHKVAKTKNGAAQVSISTLRFQVLNNQKEHSVSKD